MAAVVVRHERALLRVARQASLCDDDALDAYQRALEIFVRRVETVDPATEVAWLKVVVRHEAMAIRRARSESVTGEDVDLDEVVASADRSVEDVVASTERVQRSAEALRALKPDEATALMLKAHGLSYEEISERNGWTYTKVNRAITEGRRRFLAAYEEIESGGKCERLEGIVEALAAGAATATQLVKIRPHLRHCAACRAAVRDLHLSRLHRATLFWPAFLLAAAPPMSVEDRLRELAEQSGASTVEQRLQALVEPGTAPDAAVAVPHAGELGLQLPLPSPGRLTAARQHLSDFFHRTQASDVATGIQIATSGGGGRLATIATVLGLCLSGAGVGTVCVVTGVVSDPFGLFGEEHAPRPRARVRVQATPTATPRPVRVVRARATATPSATPRPESRPPARHRSHTRSTDPSQGTTPTSHENAPISPAPASASGADTFTPEAPQTTSAPAPPPATGGDEFTP